MCKGAIFAYWLLLGGNFFRKPSFPTKSYRILPGNCKSLQDCNSRKLLWMFKLALMRLQYRKKLQKFSKGCSP
jgi:hypothetical protein